MIDNENTNNSNINTADEEISTTEDVENPFVSKEENTSNSSVNNELDTLKTQYVRLAADFDNYRKRVDQEKEALVKYGAEEALKKLLPVLDSFERAQKSIVDIDDVAKIKESFLVIQKQFVDSIAKIGLQKIETEDKEFDPNYHEAVMQTPTNDKPNHTIIAELQSGYQLGEKVIRPALVNVAVNE